MKKNYINPNIEVLKIKPISMLISSPNAVLNPNETVNPSEIEGREDDFDFEEED